MFKRPESILVVIYTPALEILLLSRRTPPLGWWQSVTGSLEWDELPLQAARREVYEETGIVVREDQLRDTGVVNAFEIVAENRHLYAPGTVTNTEHMFTLELPGPMAIRLNPAEHDAFLWTPVREAAEKTASLTNRDAILRLTQV